MRKNQKILLATGIAFFLFLVSYKFSLYHATSQLPYLNTPDAVPLFTKIMTYVFMMIGLPPTMLIILYNTFLCHTALVSWAVQTVCFSAPFSLAGTEGFMAYIVASLISAALFFAGLHLIA